MSLSIRPEQLQIFEAELDRAFATMQALRLRKAFPERCRALSEAALLAHVEDALGRAYGHAIARPKDLARFLDLTMTLGLDFDHGPDHRWAADLIGDARRKAARRLAAIEARMVSPS